MPPSIITAVPETELKGDFGSSTLEGAEDVYGCFPFSKSPILPEATLPSLRDAISKEEVSTSASLKTVSDRASAGEYLLLNPSIIAFHSRNEVQTWRLFLSVSPSVEQSSLN